MHPLKILLRLSFLPRTLTFTRPNRSSWKGKSIEIDHCSAHCHNEYHLSCDIPAPDPAPAPVNVRVNVKNLDSDPSPLLFSDCAPEYEYDSDSESDAEKEMAVKDLHLHHLHHHLGAGASDSSGSSSSRAGLVRVVSWASILSHRCRWTRRQERDLAIAEVELARCQKAWSSEQEVWLVYIKALTEEKEAHEEFLHQRAKQQDDEQQHFRKSWDRRRSYSDEQQRRRSFSSPGHGDSRLRRRLRRHGTT